MKTVVIMVIGIEQYWAWGLKCRMAIEYLKWRADLDFEVDFRLNGAIDTIVTKWDIILFG